MKVVKRFIWPGISLLLLLGVMVYQRGIQAVADENIGYHEEIGAAIDALPLSYSNWIGRETEVPKAAAELLHANEVRAINFRDMTSGASFQFVIVHCTDARDLLGHFPPVCYPSQGWLQQSSDSATLAPQAFENTAVVDAWPCVEYQFERMDGGYSRRMAVINYMVLPDGEVTTTMEGVARAAADVTERGFGALQVQVVFSDDSIRAEQRVEIAGSLLEYLQPVLQAVWDRE